MTDLDWRTLEAARQREHPEQVFYPTWVCSHAPRIPGDPKYSHTPRPSQRRNQTVNRWGSSSVRGWREVGR